MRFIPTKVHGILDYVSGGLFLASPWLFGFADKPAAKWVPLAAGGAALSSSLFTDYELGAVRKIPMPAHLGLDVAEGALLAASPWLFGFAKKVYLPHVIFGAFALGAGLLTQKTPKK
ncbi:SPW repeat protein [Spirosoma soli]|uniref:SPW repeat protein n=1 Tax=Spirosoma soli TaxID=1770529 RepID=A0ABW5LXT2_9BACT